MQHIVKIITRILAKEADAPDFLRLNDWLNLEEKNRDKFVRLMEYWDTPVEIENSDVPEIAFEKFKKRMSTSKKISFRTIIYVAASFAILVMVWYCIPVLKSNLPVNYYTYACQDGNCQITLPDQSTVFLNRNSRITYSDRFGKENRHVTLEGEAYFEVKKSNCVFLLTIDDMAIEVLGTRFNLKAYSNDTHIVATLEEGAIMVQSKQQQILMYPDQQLIYHKNDSHYDLKQVDTELYTSWKDNLYKYNRITMEELCLNLGEIFDVRIAVNPELKPIKMSCTFTCDQGLEEILNIMKRSLPFNWTKNDDSIIIN